MIGRIKKVTPSSEDSKGNIFDFWIDVELERGHEIVVYDKNYDLREFEGKKLGLIIFAFEGMGKGDYEIIGEYKSKYRFSKDLLKRFKVPTHLLEYIKRNELLKGFIEGGAIIKTINGIFLISEHNKFKEDEYVIYNVSRFELYYWYPPKE